MMKTNLLLTLDEKVKKSKIYFRVWPFLSVYKTTIMATRRETLKTSIKAYAQYYLALL